MALGQPGSQSINAVCLYASSEVAWFGFWTEAAVFPYCETGRVYVEKLGGLFGRNQLPGVAPELVWRQESAQAGLSL